MTPDDIYGIKSLYKVIVDCEADYGDGASRYTSRYKYNLSGDRVVDIEEVNLIRYEGEERVDTLQRILNSALRHRPVVGWSPPVCIYYVKDAESPTHAKDTMNEYLKVYPGYAATEKAFDVRRYIDGLPYLKLKTTSGGRRHQRRSRRGKGKGKGKKSRSSKTLRRGRR
jgi:hypothetical protein